MGREDVGVGGSEWERTTLTRGQPWRSWPTGPRASCLSGRWRTARLEALGGEPRLVAAQHNSSMETLLELFRKLRLKMRIEVAPEPGVSVKGDEGASR